MGRNYLIAVGLVALITRLAFSVGVPPDWEWGDSSGYEYMAVNLLAGNGFSMDGVTPTRERPPAYSVFIAAVYAIVGHERYGVVLVQCVIGALTCLLAGWIASRLFGRTAGWVAQWREMLLDREQKIARPRQLYIGEEERDFVTIDSR